MGPADSDGVNRTLGYEKQDAAYFVALGANWVKVDALKMPRDPVWTHAEVARWRDGIDAAGGKGRFFFSNCHCGCMSKSDARRGGFKPWCPEITDMWRTSNDIQPYWQNILHNLDTLRGVAAQAGPSKGWNDPDILEIGVNNPVWQPDLPGLTLAEGATNFALWCVTSAPLLLGFDVTKVTDAVLKVVTNEGAIAVNQQWAGSAGDRVWGSTATALEAWLKPQPGSTHAVVVFNRGDTTVTTPTTLSAAELGLTASDVGSITSVWTGEEVKQPVSGTLPVPALPPHEHVFWLLRPATVSVSRH